MHKFLFSAEVHVQRSNKIEFRILWHQTSYNAAFGIYFQIKRRFYVVEIVHKPRLKFLIWKDIEPLIVVAIIAIYDPAFLESIVIRNPDLNLLTNHRTV